MCAGTQPTTGPALPLPGALLLENKTPLNLEVGQLGCDDSVALPAHGSASYTWASPARGAVQRLLQLRAAAPKERADLEDNGWILSAGAQQVDLLAERRGSHTRASVSAPTGGCSSIRCYALLDISVREAHSDSSKQRYGR